MTCQTVKLAKNLTVKTTGTAYRFLLLIQRHCPVQTTPRSTSPRMSTSNLRFATVLGDGHHIFDERVAHEHIKFAFRYNFGRSTPHFWREICASLQFWGWALGLAELGWAGLGVGLRALGWVGCGIWQAHFQQRLWFPVEPHPTLRNRVI